MTDRLAATSLRLLAPRATLFQTDSGDSLDNVNTTILPNGCLCFVNDSQTPGLFQLNKTGATPPDGVVLPVSGPGFWELIVIGSGASGPLIQNDVASFLLTATSLPSNVAGDTWCTFAPATPLVGASSGPLSAWSIDADTGIWTYNGQTRLFEMQMVASFAPTTAAAVLVRADIDVAAQLIGTTNTDVFTQQQESSALTTSPSNISVLKPVSIQPGQTVVPIFSSSAANRATSIKSLVLTIRAME